MLQVDALECRMSELKCDIFNNYKQTIKKLSESFLNNEEYNDHDYLDASEMADQETIEIKNNQLVKKKDETRKSSQSEIIKEDKEVLFKNFNLHLKIYT